MCSSDLFRQWWVFVGAPVEDGFSFPSGHVTACTAGMTAISLMKGKKWVAPSVIIVILMGISRNYLMAHYPSDVLCAMVIGAFSGFVAWVITRLIFRFLEEHDHVPLFALALDFDLGELLPFPVPFLSGGSDDREEDWEEPVPQRQNSGHAKAPAAKKAGVKFSLPGSYKGKHEK